MKPLFGKKRGAVGIGTLIVFIAMVLVAAVAAAVLINTSGYLQQRAEATGRQTTKEVASGLKIDSVIGYVDGTTKNISMIAIQVSPNAGSEPIDLSQAKLIINNGTKLAVLKYGGTLVSIDDTTGLNGKIFDSTQDPWSTIGASNFGIIVVQDEDGSLSGSSPTLNAGDIVILAVKADAVFGNSANGGGKGIGTRTEITIEVRPEFGAPGYAKVITPPSYGTDTIIELK
ncbi:flagellin [Thermococcus sp. MAR1]|uniref:flagellin n=1 Tax=Thermococcus sp. MAR1 TaxID=1638263 RepID=UPI00143ABB69|nr:flagellin [Thermococcus sp. MAR1]NJE10648.1 flagellin [Thermococcus sp. MAR1]